MMTMPPTPEEQVLFLRNIQRLLVEGQFTASYKFALLLAIADLCVLNGDDSGAALDLNVRDIAERFIEQYWQQCRPFQLGNQSNGLILQQNTGRQAAVISKIIKAQDDFGGSLAKLKLTAPDLWRSLTGAVKRVVNEMPLWKLQTVGSERVDFLYENLDTTTKTITLKPGVAFCFRSFYGLMRDLIQGAWVRFVQRLNAHSLGNITDLGTFLFDQERSSLDAYKSILIDVQERQCFYCHKDLRQGMDVDHFIPWSRYPTDLGNNFVLAHPRCNNAKSDYLAADQHLYSWAERNRTRSEELAQRLQNAALPFDSLASRRITEWAYEQVANANGQVWLNDAVFQHLGSTWRELLTPPATGPTRFNR
jgi:5-methylcytosine-specific restriction endonuclease McrA